MIATTLVIISAIIALSDSSYTDNLGRPAPDLASLWYPGKQTGSSLCNNPERRNADSNNLFQQPDNYKLEDYQNMQDEAQDGEYPDEEDVFIPSLRKRVVAVSPYISLGAFNNLPHFFEQLKESIERKELRQAKQMAEAAAAAAGECQRRPPRRQRPRKHEKSCMLSLPILAVTSSMTIEA